MVDGGVGVKVIWVVEGVGDVGGVDGRQLLIMTP